MKCDRCGKWHQRTFPVENEKQDKVKKERICGSCIIEIWGMHTHKIEGIATLKNLRD